MSLITATLSEMSLFQSYISPVIASDGFKFVSRVGTMWVLSNNFHQYIFKRAWKEGWWPDRRVQKGKEAQKVGLGQSGLYFSPWSRWAIL